MASDKKTQTNNKGIKKISEASVKRYLSSENRENANIEAEKGETIITSYYGTSLPEHFIIEGKKHTKGGTPLDAPDGSFIFSDSKDLLIKDPDILEHFGIKDKKSLSSGLTPAQIAKRYMDINDAKKVLLDDNATNIEKSTAASVIDGSMDMLSKLALLQEGMKGFPQGVPEVAIPYLKKVGITPEQYISMVTQNNNEEEEGNKKAEYGLYISDDNTKRRNTLFKYEEKLRNILEKHNPDIKGLERVDLSFIKQHTPVDLGFFRVEDNIYKIGYGKKSPYISEPISVPPKSDNTLPQYENKEDDKTRYAQWGISVTDDEEKPISANNKLNPYGQEVDISKTWSVTGNDAYKTDFSNNQVDSNNNNNNDYLTYRKYNFSLSKLSDIMLGGASALNSMLESAENIKKQRAIDLQKSGENIFTPIAGTDRGDYIVSGGDYGFFRPKDYVPSVGGLTPVKQMYNTGGVVVSERAMDMIYDGVRRLFAEGGEVPESKNDAKEADKGDKGNPGEPGLTEIDLSDKIENKEQLEQFYKNNPTFFLKYGTKNPIVIKTKTGKFTISSKKYKEDNLKDEIEGIKNVLKQNGVYDKFKDEDIFSLANYVYNSRKTNETLLGLIDRMRNKTLTDDDKQYLKKLGVDENDPEKLDNFRKGLNHANATNLGVIVNAAKDKKFTRADELIESFLNNKFDYLNTKTRQEYINDFVKHEKIDDFYNILGFDKNKDVLDTKKAQEAITEAMKSGSVYVQDDKKALKVKNKEVRDFQELYINSFKEDSGIAHMPLSGELSKIDENLGSRTTTSGGIIPEFDFEEVKDNIKTPDNQKREEQKEGYKPESITSETKQSKADSDTNRPSVSYNIWAQDWIKDMGALRNYFNIKRYYPYAAIPDYYLPRPVYYSPERALANIGSLSKQVIETAATLGTPQSFGATAMGVQGKAMDQAADILGQYEDKNVGIANQNEQIRAQIFNKYADDIARLKTDLHSANIAYENKYRQEKTKAGNILRKSLMDTITNAAITYNLNLANPEYITLPQYGGVQVKGYDSQLTPQKQGDIMDEWNKIFKEIDERHSNLSAKEKVDITNNIFSTLYGGKKAKSSTNTNTNSNYPYINTYSGYDETNE